MKQEHISRLLRKHREDFEEFGVLGFEIRADSEMKLRNLDSKPLKTYSTGLKTTDENLQWIDADNNALDLLHKLHDEKLNKEG